MSSERVCVYEGCSRPVLEGIGWCELHGEDFWDEGCFCGHSRRSHLRWAPGWEGQAYEGACAELYCRCVVFESYEVGDNEQ